jgi:hypothetical protein
VVVNKSEVLNAALSLPCSDRAEIARRLLLSLEPEDFDEQADEAWVEEIRRRQQAVRQGTIVARDWDAALSDLRRAIAAQDPQ